MASEAAALPVYDTEVLRLRERSDLPEEISRHGVVRHYVAEMSDDELYPVLIGQPKDSVSDTAIGDATAWMTSTKGHNRHTMLHIMKLGYPIIMIGPEGEIANPALSFTERIRRTQHISLTKIAYDMNRILDVALPQADAHPEQIIGLGESRGAMVGFGLGVSQYSGNRKLVYGDLTAPCFARQAQVGELPQIVGQLVPELFTLGGLAIKLFGNRLRHYPETLQKNPEYYLKELIKIPHLLSGQAGQLARAMRPDTPLHIKSFDSDGWSQTEEWISIFKDRGSVVLEKGKGHHLGIANPATLRGIEARLGRLANVRGYDGSFGLVNFQEVLNAHKTTPSTDEDSASTAQAA